MNERERPDERRKLGVTVVEYHDNHTVMRDPEGNEFCVEPGPVGR